MEAAKPVKSETPSESINSENFDLVEELTIKKNNEKYKIQLGTKENNNYLVIKSFSISTKNLYYYQQIYSIYELKNISKIFNLYEEIEEVISFLKNLISDVIEKKDVLIVKFKAFLPNGENQLIEFKLKKQLMSTNSTIKYLLDEISNIKAKHESDINELNENYKTAITNLKKENKKLWEEIDNLKKLSEKSKIYSLDDILDLTNILDSIDQVYFIWDYIRQNDPNFNFNFIRLLYRGSRDGDRTKTCHELCDNKTNVLIMILSDNDFIFGGYSKIGFQANNTNPEYKIDNDSFLFSVNLQKIYPVKYNALAICNIDERCGLCFNSSLAFFDNFMNNFNGNIFPVDNAEVFCKPTYVHEMNGGVKQFRCLELEVFQIF